jgi:hypothetical protein
MARVNLSVPDELLKLIRRDFPHLNLSAVLHEGLRGALHCEHEVLACVRCAAPIEAQALVDEGLSGADPSRRRRSMCTRIESTAGR